MGTAGGVPQPHLGRMRKYHFHVARDKVGVGQVGDLNTGAGNGKAGERGKGGGGFTCSVGGQQ